MKRVGLPLTAATDPELEGQLLKKLSFDTWDDMFAAIGYGGLTAAKPSAASGTISTRH